MARESSPWDKAARTGALPIQAKGKYRSAGITVYTWPARIVYSMRVPWVDKTFDSRNIASYFKGSPDYMWWLRIRPGNWKIAEVLRISQPWDFVLLLSEAFSCSASFVRFHLQCSRDGLVGSNSSTTGVHVVVLLPGRHANRTGSSSQIWCGALAHSVGFLGGVLWC